MREYQRPWMEVLHGKVRNQVEYVVLAVACSFTFFPICANGLPSFVFMVSLGFLGVVSVSPIERVSISDHVGGQRDPYQT